MAMKSRRKTYDHILGVISARQAESLWRDWANLPSPVDYPQYRGAVERFLSRYPYVFQFRDGDGAEAGPLAGTADLNVLLAAVRTGLCRAWLAPDAHHRDWYIFQLRYAYERTRARIEEPDPSLVPESSDTPELQARRSLRSMITDLLQDVPPATPFEAAIFYLHSRLADRMLRCANPGCVKPYFFRMKKGQKYCSAACADPARRESKRTWWNQNRGKSARS
jgi:hypothetical protein